MRRVREEFGGEIDKGRRSEVREVSWYDWNKLNNFQLSKALPIFNFKKHEVILLPVSPIEALESLKTPHPASTSNAKGFEDGQIRSCLLVRAYL